MTMDLGNSLQLGSAELKYLHKYLHLNINLKAAGASRK